jgi:gluconolactonase
MPEPHIATDAISVYADGLDHPEGVTVGPDGAVWAGGEGGQVYRIEGEPPTVVQVGSCGGFTLGLAVDGFGFVYTTDPVHRCVHVFGPDGRHAVYSTGAPAPQIRAPNHLGFDSEGNLYVSDSGRWKEDDGCIYRIRPGGEGEIWCNELRTLPNGVCVGPGGEQLYVAMSLNPSRVSRVEIRDDGSAGRVEDVAIMPGTLADGLAFDENGDLYVATYRPESVWVVPRGSSQAALYAHDPEGWVLASPTNLAFAPGGERRLFAANIGRWHIAQLPVPAGGLSLQHPTAEGLGWGERE